MTEAQTATVAQYVYGVAATHAQLPDGLTGVGEQPVRTEALGDVAAVVSDLPDAEAFGRPADIRAHTSVLDAIARQTSVLPMAFATIVADLTELARAVPAEEQEHYLQGLDEVAGAAQYTLRVGHLEEAVLAELIAHNPQIAALREATAGRSEDESYHERIQLGELVVQALERRRPDEATPILAAVQAQVRQFRERETTRAEDVLDVAVLVSSEQVQAFEETVEELAAGAAGRLHFRLIGPQAPYDFVPGE